MNEVLARIMQFKPLTPARSDVIREAAVKRVHRRIGNMPPTFNIEVVGEEPAEEQYRKMERTWRSLMEPMDYLIPPIFLIVVLISLSHMLDFSGRIAYTAYQAPPGAESFAGIALSVSTFIYIHQLGFFGFSELGVLFFYSRFSMHSHEKRRSLLPLRWRGTRQEVIEGIVARLALYLNVNLWFAVFCAGVVFYANVVSLTHGGDDSWVPAFIGFLIPAMTLVLGERISELIREKLLDRQRVRALYEEERARWVREWQYAQDQHRAFVRQWQEIHNDPTLFNESKQHNYRRYLAEQIIAYYKTTAEGRRTEWDSEIETYLAARELAAMEGMVSLDAAITFFTPRTTSNSSPSGSSNTETPPAENDVNLNPSSEPTQLPLPSPTNPDPSHSQTQVIRVQLPEQ